jgi:transcriptional regulator with XRE-family HTH domain
LTGPEFRKIRLRLGLTQDEIARELDIDRRTVGRWERGEVNVPKVVAFAMKYLVLRKGGRS